MSDINKEVKDLKEADSERLDDIKESSPDTVAKAHVFGIDQAIERTQSRPVDHTLSNGDAFDDKDGITPPYDPETLSILFWHSNSLRQNVDAYVTNIDGFGHRFEPCIDLDDDDIDQIVRDSLIQEQSINFGYPEQLPTEAAVIARKKQIEAQMRTEKSRLDFFFKYCYPGASFTKLRKITRQDIEVTGNGYWEVLRDKKGRLATFAYLPAHTMRVTHEDSSPTLVNQRVMPTPLSYSNRQYFRSFRKFVQEKHGQSVFFKEFNDPRVISSTTGKAYNSEEELYAKEGLNVRPANEVIHFKIHSANSPYGVPRWIGVLTSVLGSRKADEVNLMYFENKSIPPMAMLVSGGRVTEETIKRIEDHIENEIKGSQNFHNILLIEGEGPLTQGGTENTGRMKIELKPLTQAISSDALFQNYDEKNIRKVGMSFRLPPLLRGDSRDFNRACYDDQTETLTHRGWKKLNEFLPDDKIAAYCPKKKVMEFVKPEKLLVYDVNEELLHFKNNKLDIMVTEDHRMLVKSLYKKSDEFEVHKSHEIPYTRFKMKTVVESSRGSEIKEFWLPKDSSCKIERGHKHDAPVDGNTFIEFLGYWLSEGSLLSTSHKASPYIVTLSQRNGPKADSIRSCLDKLGWKYSESYTASEDHYRWTLSNRCLSKWLRDNCGAKDQDRVIPDDFLSLSERQTRILLDALMLGDGHWDSRDGRGCGFYPSISKNLCDAVQILAIKLGYTASTSLHYRKRKEHHHDCYRVLISEGRDIHFASEIKRVLYKGKVYCFSVPSHGFFVTRRNGKVAVQGNTALAVLKFTETQVFAPERTDFDDLINRTILAELDICFWKFASNSPKTTDPEDQAKVLERLTKIGSIVPSESREIAAEILNRDMKKIRDPWVNVPFPLTVAGRVDDVLILGDLVDVIEQAMSDGSISAGEAGVIEEYSQELAPDDLDEQQENSTAAEGSKPPEKPVDEQAQEQSKADLSTGSLDSGGKLTTEQRGKLDRLPPSIGKRVAHILSNLKKDTQSKTLTLKVDPEEWAKWQEGFVPEDYEDE